MTISIREFSDRLDELFNVRRFEELSNWDFALDLDEREELLARGGNTFRACFNGLLNAANADARTDHVYLAVFPEKDVLDFIIDEEKRRGGRGSVIVTHHPCDMETSDRGFVALSPRQLDEMFELNLAIYVLHAPLDCHAELSTSGTLAEGLGLRRTGVFAPYVGGHAGVIGEQLPEPFATFADRVLRLCELPHFQTDQVRFNGQPVSRVAIVAGGGDDPADLKEAERLGADTFLGGHWWTPHAGEWAEGNRQAIAALLPDLSMNLLSASHDGSELVVFRDRLQPLFESWGLETKLVRQADHWR